MVIIVNLLNMCLICFEQKGKPSKNKMSWTWDIVLNPDDSKVGTLNMVQMKHEYMCPLITPETQAMQNKPLNWWLIWAEMTVLELCLDKVATIDDHQMVI